MRWQDIYTSKLTTAQEAVKNIQSTNRVVIGHACSEPLELVDAMVHNKDQYENVEIVHMVAMGKSEYAKPEMAKHFRHNALFVGGSTRKAVNEARADYTPCFFTEVPRLFKEDYLPVDVALIQVSRPDEHGYCSFGLSCDYTKPAAECAKLVIAEVNDQLPRTMGDNFIHISEIDHIIETSYPIIELNPPKIGEIEKQIGENCAKLIENGSTLQLGIGAIPDAVLLFLKDKKDLGIHSEMFSDGVVELVEAGVINNKKKTLHKGKMVVTFLMGTKRLYDFVDNNPSVELYSVDYVNNPCVIMQNDNMVSVNSCIQIDLMGQIVSESIGLRQFSGVGGQVDYVRGVSMGKNGKSIIAIPSTASKGTVSRIVPLIDEGSAVTTTRNDVHYIVTEYGIASLRGKSLKERGRALIHIAHPDFRPMLIEEWEKRFDCKF
ncbi:acetyl-CoA hydrolase/transferase family protein [Marinisporobacter balticus]|uniref:4-hydroxybutyrate CoA-transferase n=1 Tax=Marinisporobacter balticus TaxID=2018667 RepID=A0A4R2L1N2_9FIRM|nr:acetyl-CoA hydrolase/transferase C-terminal domain-containing protein [Marinisporobacter balticus]TCO79522.1 4-hydroxybutyrate CoA-transferase [Marinisporobacter balticus]